VLCLGLRARLAVQGVYDGPRIFFPTHLRIDSLLFGVLLAWAHHLRPQWLAIGRHRRALVLVGIALLSPMFFVEASAGPFVATVGFTLLYLGYGAILIAAVAPRTTPPRAARRLVRAIAAVGTVSYPMYLWFVDIGLSLPMLGVPRRPPDWLRLQGVSNSIEQAGWWLLTQLLYVSVTVAVGTLAAMVVERPFLALRERWFPSRAEIAP
jgi:peptidoglycan/LPS O-acetylase OafA/YrhL